MGKNKLTADTSIDTSFFDRVEKQLNSVIGTVGELTDKIDDVKKHKMELEVDDNGLKIAEKNLDYFIDKYSKTKLSRTDFINNKGVQKEVNDLISNLEKAYNKVNVDKQRLTENQTKSFVESYTKLLEISNLLGVNYIDKYKDMMSSIREMLKGSNDFSKDIGEITSDSYNAIVNSILKNFRQEFFKQHKSDIINELANEANNANKLQIQQVKESEKQIHELEEEKREEIRRTQKVLEDLLNGFVNSRESDEIFKIDLKQFGKIQEAFRVLISLLNEAGIETEKLEDTFDVFSNGIIIPNEQIQSEKKSVSQLREEVEKLNKELQSRPSQDQFDELYEKYSKAEEKAEELRSVISGLESQLSHTGDQSEIDYLNDDLQYFQSALFETRIELDNIRQELEKVKTERDELLNGKRISSELDNDINLKDDLEFNPDGLDNFVDILKQIELHLRNIKNIFGSIDDNSSFKNLIDATEILLGKIDEIYSKVGTGINNIVVNQGVDRLAHQQNADVDAFVKSTLSRYKNAFDKIADLAGGEERLFAYINSAIDYEGGIDQLSKTFSSNAVTGIQNMEMQIYRLMDFFKVLRQAMSSDEFGLNLGKTKIPSSSDANFRSRLKELSGVNDKDVLEFEDDKLDLTIIVDKLEEIRVLIDNISQKDLFGSSLEKIESVLSILSEKLQGIFTMNNEGIIPENSAIGDLASIADKATIAKDNLTLSNEKLAASAENTADKIRDEANSIKDYVEEVNEANNIHANLSSNPSEWQFDTPDISKHTFNEKLDNYLNAWDFTPQSKESYEISSKIKDIVDEMNQRVIEIEDSVYHRLYGLYNLVNIKDTYGVKEFDNLFDAHNIIQNLQISDNVQRIANTARSISDGSYSIDESSIEEYIEDPVATINNSLKIINDLTYSTTEKLNAFEKMNKALVTTIDWGITKNDDSEKMLDDVESLMYNSIFAEPNGNSYIKSLFGNLIEALDLVKQIRNGWYNEEPTEYELDELGNFIPAVKDIETKSIELGEAVTEKVKNLAIQLKNAQEYMQRDTIDILKWIKNGNAFAEDFPIPLVDSFNELGLVDDITQKINVARGGMTNLGVFQNDDYTIIGRQEEHLPRLRTLIKLLKEAKDEGANVGQVLGVVWDKESKVLFDIQETLSGKVIDDDNLEFLQATDEQIEKLISDVEILKKVGLHVDIVGENITYDPQKGFGFFDLSTAQAGNISGQGNFTTQDPFDVIDSLMRFVSRRDREDVSERFISVLDNHLNNQANYQSKDITTSDTKYIIDKIIESEKELANTAENTAEVVISSFKEMEAVAKETDEIIDGLYNDIDSEKLDVVKEEPINIEELQPYFDKENQTVDNIGVSEINALSSLADAIQEVIDKVEAKTRAFQEEGQVVDGVVQNEITNLELLLGNLVLLERQIKDVSDTFSKMSIDLDTSNIDITNIDSFMDVFSRIKDEKIDEQLISIFSLLDDFAKEVNKIKIDDASILSSINNILTRTTELENLANVLQSTKKQIDAVNKATSSKNEPNNYQSKYYNKLSSALRTGETDLQYLKDRGKNLDEYFVKYEELFNQLKSLKEVKLDFVSEEQYEELLKIIESLKLVKREASFAENKDVNEKSIQKYLGQINDILSKNTKSSFKKTDIYRQLKDLQSEFENFDLSKPQSELDELGNTALEVIAKFKGLDDSLKGGGFLKNFTHRLADMNAKFFAQYFSFQDLIRYGRTAITTIIQLDTALVDLRKTTSMNTQELNEFYRASTDIGKQLGVTSQQIIQQAADWSRLGYSTKEQAETMAELSSKFASVSPGMSTEQSTDYLVSTMKAFGIETDEVERKIMDNVNRIGKILPKHMVTYGAKLLA